MRAARQADYFLKKIFPCRKFTRLLRIVFLFSVIFFCIGILSNIGLERLRDENFLGIPTCPACYGQSMCTDLLVGEVSLVGWHRYSGLDLFNLKNVFTAIHSDGRPLVLKRLAHLSEIKNFDKHLCKQMGVSYPCHAQNLKFKSHMEMVDLNSRTLNNISDLMACPSDRLVRLMTRTFSERNSQNLMQPLTSSEKMVLFTTLKINPEPLLLQMFPQRKGWPLPKYYGACGRFVIEEFVGPTIGDFFSEKWEVRVDLAYKVLALAHQFTNNSQQFALYMTDVSADNFAVSPPPQRKVMLVDAENVIVVDKEQIMKEKKAGWNEKYSHTLECSLEMCLAFDPKALCSHYHTDHNYFAVCKNVLRPLIMTNLPKIIRVQWRLDFLLEQCIKPKQPDGRFQLVPQLLATLDTLRTLKMDTSYL